MLELLADPALMRLPVHQVPKAPLDLQEKPDTMDPQESPEFQPLMNHSNQESLENPVMLDPPDPLELPEIQAKMVSPAHQDPKEQKDLPDPMVPMDSQVHKVPLDPPVHQEKRVFVRSTALWTAACSSRTALDDRRPTSR